MKRSDGGRLLFVISAATSYRLQRYVFERAMAAQRHVMLLYTGGRDGLFTEISSHAERLGIEAVALDEVVEAAQGPRPWCSMMPPRTCRSLAATASMAFLERPRRMLQFRRTYARRAAAVLQLLRRRGIDAALCSEDGISSDLTVMAAASARHVPVVDIPYGNGTGHELEVDLDQKAKDGRLIVAAGRDLKVLKAVAPGWLKRGRHANALMHPVEVVLAMESVGASLRDAWIIHGGHSDVLCAENPVGLRQYLHEGIPEGKLRLTGSPYCDVMVDALRNAPDSAAALRRPRRIDPETTRILVSWPPSYHETYLDRNEFPSYAEMTRATFAYLRSLPNTTLTVSLHPACDGSVNRILDELGIPVADEYLLELIPRHDIFVTYFSSTIRWALAAGKVVVNYDAYRLGLSTYDDAPGFVNTGHFAEFCQAVDRLTASEAAFAELAAKQIAVAGDWGTMDGECTQRIFAEVDRLIAERQGRGR